MNRVPVVTARPGAERGDRALRLTAATDCGDCAQTFHLSPGERAHAPQWGTLSGLGTFTVGVGVGAGVGVGVGVGVDAGVEVDAGVTRASHPVALHKLNQCFSR